MVKIYRFFELLNLNQVLNFVVWVKVKNNNWKFLNNNFLKTVVRVIKCSKNPAKYLLNVLYDYFPKNVEPSVYFACSLVTKIFMGASDAMGWNVILEF